MEATTQFRSAQQFAAHLRALHEDRSRRKLEVRAHGHKRLRLSAAERRAILSKTGGRCHICGGEIDGAWDADHVFAHAQGGAHATDNYLPAHSICNTYRWFYGTEEFQWILKLGVWLRTQIESGDDSALGLAERFIRHEARRDSRRRRRDNG
jgi:5-methylcytosine-specific restriction endonuclease McrA